MINSINNINYIKVSEIPETAIKIEKSYDFGFGVSVKVFETDGGREAIISNMEIR